MKLVYCAVCGTTIPVIRKAMAKYATIIDIIEPHVCLDNPMVPDLKQIDNPRIDINKKENKFVQSLNKLQPPSSPFSGVSTNDLRDRRFETSDDQKLKSSAPPTILEMIGTITNSIPERNLVEPESEE